MAQVEFYDSVMDLMLNGNAQQSGWQVITNERKSPVEGNFVRPNDILQQALPRVQDHELPLSLDDSRRIFASPLPGVRLTHPLGSLEGGPGSTDGQDSFADAFLANHPGITSADQLQEAVDQEVQSNLKTLHERMLARQKAKEKNEALEREIQALINTHNMELRVQRKMLDERNAKREAKERRRQEKVS